MAGKTIIMSKLNQVLRLRGNGVPLQTIAKVSGLSRNTIKKYRRLIEIKNIGQEQLLEMDDEMIEALVKEPDPVDELRYESLAALFPMMEKELTRKGVNPVKFVKKIVES